MQSQFSRPALPATFALADDVREALGRTSAEAHSRLTEGAKFLLALTAKSARTGSPVFAGVGLAEKAKRRTKGRISKASRKANR